MQMGAITEHYGLADALVRSINAGVDILILSNNIATYDPLIADKAHQAILKAIESGTLSKERIGESAKRIENLKKQYGIIR